MIQQAIWLAVGALVTLVLLALMDGDSIQDNILPVAIGAIAAFFWPIVIGWFLVRRAKERRNNQIEDEVQRQLNQQRPGG